jgi:hypothetical protein
MRKPDPETLKLLRGYSEEEWLTYYNALVVIAKRECKSRYWKTGNAGHLPEGYSPETVVQEAVARLFDGRRTWNQEEYPGPSPMKILRATVQSIVGDLVRSEEHKHYAYLEPANDEDEPDSDGHADRLVHQATKKNAYNLPDNQDHTYALDNAIAHIRGNIRGRADIATYFELLLRGLKRVEISKEMKVSADRVDEIRKQFLARTVDIYRELFGDKQSPRDKGARATRD